MPPPQRGPGIHHCCWQRLQPVQYGSHTATKMQGNTLSVYQPLGTLDIIGGSRMVKRFNRQIIIFIPLAGADVQFVDSTFRIHLPADDPEL